MKKHGVILRLAVFALVTLTGCQSNNADTPPYPVTVTADGQNIALREIEAAEDSLLERRPDQDIDFTMERAIFAPLLEDINIVRVPMNSVIEIKLSEPFESLVLYDHLLREDGSSYFNRMIVEQELTLEDDIASFELAQHISAYLSSDSRFLEDGSIRGFRLIINDGGGMKEYAFVIYIK